jgi:hypothetical protein
MNEGKRQKSTDVTLFAMLLARLMQLAAKRMGNEGLHTFGAEAISFFFWRLLHIRCPQGSILFVETRKRKVSSKSVAQPTTNQPQPSNPPNQPTSQNKNPSAQVSKEWHS